MPKPIKLFALTLLAFSSTCAFAAEENPASPTAQYLANEGLMVTHKQTKILFDPLFRNNYGQYLLLPEQMEAALFAGESPFDGIDAVFISHYHGDHFSPADILRLLKTQTHIQLYAPSQAVDGLREVAGADDAAVFERVTPVNLEYKDAPVAMYMDGLLIEAVRIPHAGWPTGRLDVANISWRVTLDETTTVVHMGDADPNDVHFARDADYWDKAQVDMAFPPYWFFGSTYGADVLEQRVQADHNVGVHVPVTIPAEPSLRPDGLRDVDLFTQPGETREIPLDAHAGAHHEH
jgi:L-ascorbate metabolism protein UlaG (beta-lactamase superfamily)